MLKYYGVTKSDLQKNGIKIYYGKERAMTQIKEHIDYFCTEFIAQYISQLKYGKYFKKRTLQTVRELEIQASKIKNKESIFSQNIDFKIPNEHFSNNEILYNARLNFH